MASASDSDGAIAKVEFYVDAVKLGEDTTAPYSFPWKPVTGNYTLTARAIDNKGAATISAPVVVQAIPVVNLSVLDNIAYECGINRKFNVSRTSSVTAPLTVYYAMSGTATNGRDYNNLSGSVVIPVGLASVDIIVQPIDDEELEYKETVTLTLTDNPAYKFGKTTSGTMTLLDNEVPQVMVYVCNSVESESGQYPSNYFRFWRRFGKSTTTVLTVKFSIGGTATAGVDYVALPETVTIAAGNNYVDLALTPLDDTLVEGTETIVLTLTEDVAYQLYNDTSVTVTLTDND